MKKRIITAFAFIFTFFVIGGGVAVFSLFTTATSQQKLINLHEIAGIRQNLILSVTRVEFYVYAPAKEFSANIDTVITNTMQMDDAIGRCKDCHHSEEVVAELKSLELMSKEFQEKLSFLVTSLVENEWRRDNQKRATELADLIVKRIQDMVNRAAMTIQNRTSSVMAQIHRSNMILTATFLITLLIAFFIARHLTRSIIGPVRALADAAVHITDGNLGYRINYDGKEEFKELIRIFNVMSNTIQVKDRENKELCLSLAQRVEELKQTQKQLVEAEKLTALGTLAGGIAHDFNNILCGIISNITLIKRMYNPSQDAFTLLEIIEKAGFRAAHLVQQLLTFSRQEKWQPKPLDLNQSVRHVLTLIGSTFPAATKVIMDLDDSLPLIHGDAARIEQVVMNLCINARDALTDDGEILIKTSRHIFPAQSLPLHPEARQGEYAELLVKDNGTGMEPETLARIFEPFFTTKPFGQGTGLGLAMVHGIVKSHNGFCLVDSSPNKGTTFKIYLPISVG